MRRFPSQRKQKRKQARGNVDLANTDGRVFGTSGEWQRTVRVYNDDPGSLVTKKVIKGLEYGTSRLRSRFRCRPLGPSRGRHGMNGERKSAPERSRIGSHGKDPDGARESQGREFRPGQGPQRT